MRVLHARQPRAALIRDQTQMKAILVALLLSLALTGCIVDPGGGNRDHGWANHDAFHGDHRAWND